MSGLRQRGSGVKLAAALGGVAVAYLVAGELSLWAMPPGYPPAVWAPAGLALVAVLLGGARMVPAVALGSLAVNLISFFAHAPRWGAGGSVAVAVTVGAGAAMQAWMGAYVIRRFVVAPAALDEARDVGLFLILAGPLSSTVSATVATLALSVGTAASDNWLRWWTWWLGDTTGTLLFAPLLVTWVARPRHMPGRRLWVTVPVVLASALVVMLFARASRWEQARIDAGLRRRTDAVTSALERGSDHYLHVVQSIADYHRAAGRVDRDAFQAFVRGALGRDPGIRLLGWIPRVTAPERASYEAGGGQRPFAFKEWGPHGELRPAAARPEYYPLLFLEPEAGNEEILGIDVASTRRWRTELAEAGRTGQTAAGISVAMLGHGAPAFVVMAPVFAADATSAPPGDTDRLRGFAIGICSLSALAEAALRVGGADGLALSLSEPAIPGEHTAPFVYPPDRPHPAGCAVSSSPRIAGHAWTMKLVPGARDQAVERSWQPWLVLTSGILFVTWLEAFLLIITGHTSKVELLVAQRTSELEVSNRAFEDQRAELTRSNAELAAALTAKEILLRELHHRVKNNLQVIASLFSLQARYLPDPRYREIFEESRNRVFSIALAHEKLYRSKDLGRIDFSEYARNLVAHLQSMFGGTSGIGVVTEIHEVRLPVETAIPCGLVINELVSNAFKHAFPDGRRGTIRVVLRELEAARWLIAIEDDGVGLPAGISLGKTESLGLDLVSILAAQIGAEVDVRREGGTSFRLTFAARRRADA